jgi:pimeloyl-ACP methyl ester carboxylesterase
MPQVRSGDAEIVYHVLGSGPPVVLLHPFPACYEFWLPAAQALSARYRLILPDLRAHGDSEAGEGTATMQKHAMDILHVLRALDIGRAAFVGVSIGGYILFELWRRERGRMAALALCNTKASPDTPEARATRLQSAEEVLQHGTATFLDNMIPRLIGATTRSARPDLVASARRMMEKMSPEDVRAIQLGMAERPDSTPTLRTINVPSLIVTGDEDVVTGVADAQPMQQNISGSTLRVIPKAGHYAAFEQSEPVGVVLRQFLDGLTL